MAKKKFYVVWKGLQTGVFDSWAACQGVINGYSGAKYKSFPSRQAAEEAFREDPDSHYGKSTPKKALSQRELDAIGQPVEKSLCVDAAWNATTKVMEYQGVWMPEGAEAFHMGPYNNGTNNIGEFLAIVHALLILQEANLDIPIYSDSKTAMAWVRNKRANSASITKRETSSEVNDLVYRAEQWLKSNSYSNEILKWRTEAWGEVPADFGRK